MERLFKYELTYYNQYLDKEVTDIGILCAEDYCDAARKLTSNEGYGKENTYSIKIEDTQDSVLNTEELKSYALLV